jgi:hypothetical protein
VDSSQTPVSDDPDAALVGTWLLESVVQFGPAGQVDPGSFFGGEGATGTLIYAPDGWMSVLIQSAPRPQAASRGPRHYGYFGQYEIDWDRFVVKHFVRQSLWPSENGRIVERRFELAAGKLTLDAMFLVDGRKRLNRLLWRRAD